jgi:hypothetical protein
MGSIALSSALLRATVVALLFTGCGGPSKPCPRPSSDQAAASAVLRTCASWLKSCDRIAEYAYNAYCDDFTRRCREDCTRGVGSDERCRACLAKEEATCKPTLEETRLFCRQQDEACRERARNPAGAGKSEWDEIPPPPPR